MKILICALVVLSSCSCMNLIPKEKGIINALNGIFNIAIEKDRFHLFAELKGKRRLDKLFKYTSTLENFDRLDVNAFLNRNVPGAGFDRLNTAVSLLPSRQKALKYLYKDVPDPMVEVEEGWLRGARIRPEKYRHFDAFLGIPYASKPERFQTSKPMKPWKGVRDALQEQYVCIQYLPEFNDLIGSEDCLYADVMTPSIKMKGLPVVVWVHGGLFKLGFGNVYYYGPDFLMQEDIVLVMFNYRLGPFGFMSTQDNNMVANLGMKDIVFFLKWLKRNIKNFGGDPDNVTLFGISTGAAAIQLLTVSPMAEGLYHKAIVNSASLKHPWVYTSDPVANVYRLAKNLDIKTSDRRQMVEDLKKVNARLMVRAAEKIYRDQYPDEEYLAFVPCAEVEIPGEERFLTEYPDVLLESGNYTKVPMMLGFMSGEGIFWLSLHGTARLFDDIEYIIPRNLMTGLKTHQQKEQLIRRVKDFYFDGGRRLTEQKLMEFISDAKILHMLQSYTRKLVTDSPGVPIFLYEFAYNGYLGQTKSFTNVSVEGVAHADDCGYVFRLLYGDPLEDDHETDFVIRRQVHLIANFAKYGHPTPETTNMTPIRWEPVSNPTNLEYLRIAKDIEMKTRPYERRMKFWDEMYKQFAN